MSHGVRLRIWGQTACFTRPEMRVEQVSYEVITPSAARGVLEAVYWKPQIRWVVTGIHVLAPIRFVSLRRNGVGSKVPVKGAMSAMKKGEGSLGLYADDQKVRQQLATQALLDVHYVIDARFDIRSGSENAGKHLAMFERRAKGGQCFHRPYLGCREHECHFAWVDQNKTIPPLDQPLPESWRTGIDAIDNADRTSLRGERDLGYMLLDIDHERGRTPHFFKALISDGSITGIDKEKTFS